MVNMSSWIYNKGEDHLVTTILSLQNQSQEVIKSIHCNFFRTWTWALKALNLVGVVPYKPILDTIKNQWEFKKNGIFFQIFSMVALWIPLLSDFCRRFPDEIAQFSNGRRSASTYFQFLSYILYPVKYAQLLHALYFGKTDLEEMVNLLFTGNLFNWSNKKPRRAFFRGAYMFILMVLLTKLSKIVMLLVNFPISKIFGTGQPFTENILNALEKWEDFAVDLLDCALELILIGIVPVTLWLAAKQFEEFVLHSNLQGIKENALMSKGILARYEELKRISRLFNYTLGSVYLTSVIHTCLWFVLTLDDVVKTMNFLDIGLMVVTVVLHTMALFICGEVFKMMERFKNWLLESCNWNALMKNLGVDELDRIVLELGRKPIGMGSRGVYLATYDFAAQLGIVAMTVFLINFNK